MGENTVHQGHRARMKNKFALHGADVFDSYELLEMLLYFSLPYCDTNPPAHRLLSAFGSLDGVFSAPREALSSVDGIGGRTADFLLSVGKQAKNALFYRGIGLPCFDTYDKAAQFFLSRLKDREKPTLDALFLDNRMCGIAVERLYEMDFSSGAVNPISCVRKALEYHASVVILAHNRRYGVCYPTESDRAGFRSFNDALTLAGIKEADHFLVVGDKLTSLRCFHGKLHGTPELSAFYDTYPKTASPVLYGEELTLFSDPSVFTDDGLAISSFFSPLYGEEKSETLAAALLSRFGSAERVFSADLRTVAETDGVGENPAFFIRLCMALSSRRLTESFPIGKPVGTHEIKTYFTSRFAGKQDEEVLMMMFDKEENVLGVSLVSKGTVNSSHLDRRLCLETAVRHGAASVILAHNHPGGVPDPSEDDYSATGALADALLTVNVKLKDHFVVAGCRCESLFRTPLTDPADPTLRRPKTLT